MNPVPTPTPYAFETVERITTLNAGDWSIWNYADDAINIWNYEPNLGLVIQTAVIVILVVAFMMILIRELQKIQDEK